MARMVRVTLLSLPAHAWWWRGHALPLLCCPVRGVVEPCATLRTRCSRPVLEPVVETPVQTAGGEAQERWKRTGFAPGRVFAWSVCVVGGWWRCRRVGGPFERVRFGLVWRGGVVWVWSRARVCARVRAVVRGSWFVWGREGGCSGRVCCPWRGRCGPGLVVVAGPVPQHFPTYSHVSLDIPV
jgi:hypothetical protein